MTVEEALSAIRDGEAAGKQKYAVRQDLLAAGASSEVIDAAMAIARGEAPAPPASQADDAGPLSPPAGMSQGQTATSAIVLPEMPAWLLGILTGLLVLAYFGTFSRFYGPNWTVQYLAVLLMWAWAWRNDARFGLVGGIAVAALTAAAIFLAGIRMMTVGFGVGLAFAVFGGRWSSGSAKVLIVVVNVVFLLWFLYGLANPEARSPFV